MEEVQFYARARRSAILGIFCEKYIFGAIIGQGKTKEEQGSPFSDFPLFCGLVIFLNLLNSAPRSRRLKGPRSRGGNDQERNNMLSFFKKKEKEIPEADQVWREGVVERICDTSKSGYVEILLQGENEFRLVRGACFEPRTIPGDRISFAVLKVNQYGLVERDLTQFTNHTLIERLATPQSKER